MKFVLVCAAITGFAFGQPQVPPDQQANAKKLETDLSAIKNGSRVTGAMLRQLESDVMAMAKGATKPSPASVNKLVTDLTADLSGHTFSVANLAKLAADVNAVLNSSGIPQSEVTAAISNAETILNASGVTAADVQLITADLQAIASTAQAGRGTKRFQRK